MAEQVIDVGTIIILKTAFPYTNVTGFTTWTDDANGETATKYFTREFRFSRDGSSFSEYQELTDANLQNIPTIETDSTSFEFRYTVVGDEMNFDVLCVSNVILTTVPSAANQLDPYYSVQDPYINAEGCLQSNNAGTPNCLSCGVDTTQINTSPIVNNCQPIIGVDSNYDFYNNAACLQQELSGIITSNFGHAVEYYKAVPEKEGNDIILKEWTLYKVLPKLAIKVIVPDNQFPDSMLKYDPFGIQFERPFEIHIDKKYFESIFGTGLAPSKFDILYFPNMNRIYEIHDVYLFNSYGNTPLYYKISLIKYKDRTNRDEGVNTQELDDLTISFDGLFGEERNEQIEQRVKRIQNSVDNPLRRTVAEELAIVKETIYNNSIIISATNYDLSNYTTAGLKLLEYNKEYLQLDNENRAVMFWFKKTSDNNSSNLIFGTDQDSGIKISMVNNDEWLIKLANNDYNYQMSNDIELNKWYALLLNISNLYQEMNLSIYTVQSGTTVLDEVFYENKPIVPMTAISDDGVGLYGSEFNITNIRLFSQIVNTEHKQIVLNQQIVQDAQLAIIIDNAKPNQNLPKLSRPL